MLIVQKEALVDFGARIAHYESSYETLIDGSTPWIKIIDAGRGSSIHVLQIPFWLKLSSSDAAQSIANNIWLTDTVKYLQYSR